VLKLVIYCIVSQFVVVLLSYNLIMQLAIKYLVASQLAMFVFALICFAVDPDAFRNNAPLSYYGTMAKTIFPYATGILLTAFLLFRGAQHLHGKKVRAVRFSVQWLAILLVAALATPYTVFFWAHSAVTNLMMFLVIGASGYILIKIDHRLINIALALAMVCMFTLITLSADWWDIVHVAGPAELAASLLFIGLLYNTLKDIKEETI
jgi:hypothetical protein